MRKVGIRIKPLPAASSHLSIASFEVYDIESGQAFSNMMGVELKYDAKGPIAATVTLLVSEIGEWPK